MTSSPSKATSTERRGWLGVVSVALGSFSLVLSEFLPIGLLPSIAADLHVGIGTAGLMVVATGLTAAVAAPVVTVLTSSIDRRFVLWGLTVLLIVADVAGAFAANFGILLLARMLLGVALGGFWAIGAGLASRLVAAPSVIRATSIITAGVSVATVVSLPLGSFLAQIADWRVAFLAGAALGAAALVGQLILLSAIPSTSKVRFSTLGGLLRLPRARVGLVATAFVFLAQFAAYTYVTPYLEDLVRVDASTVTVALLVFGLAGIAGNFVAGVTLSRNLLATLGVAKVALAAAIILLPLLAWSLPGVIVLLVVWGFVWGALPLGMQTWMAQASTNGAESGLALFVTTIQLAIAGGSIVGSIAVSASGLAFDFGLAGAIAGVGAVVLLVLGARFRPTTFTEPVGGPAVSTGSVPVATGSTHSVDAACAGSRA